VTQQVAQPKGTKQKQKEKEKVVTHTIIAL
jgi:hypothetical protein